MASDPWAPAGRPDVAAPDAAVPDESTLGVPTPEAETASVGVTAETERLDRIEAELAEIEAALGRLDDGSYGRCEACGRSIDEAALAAGAAARRCTGHAETR